MFRSDILEIPMNQRIRSNLGKITAFPFPDSRILKRKRSGFSHFKKVWIRERVRDLPNLRGLEKKYEVPKGVSINSLRNKALST